jgi:hypothetical protein
MPPDLAPVLAQYAAGHLSEVLERIELAVYAANRAGVLTEGPACDELLRAVADATGVRARYADEVKDGRAAKAGLFSAIRVVVGSMRPMRTNPGRSFVRSNEFPNGWNAALHAVASAASLAKGTGS